MKIRQLLSLTLTIALFLLFLPAIVSAGTIRLGGMDLDGYCQSQNQGRAILVNNTWSCQSGSAINMNAACQWQYRDPNATASQDTPGNPYTWSCYREDPQVTPTPTPSTTPALTPTPTVTPASTPTPTPTPSSGTSSLAIYTDSLASNWADASYNTTVTVTTTNTYRGTAALAAAIRSDGGLNFQARTSIQSRNYTTLRFALRATQSGQRYEVYADSVYGQPLRAPVSLTNYGGQPTTSWRVYTIPLADLGAANVALRDIVIHDATSSNQATLFVDEVSLTGAGTATPTPTPTPTGTPSPTPTQSLTPTPTPSNLRIRKSIYALSPDELQRLVNAINTIRANGVYQDFMNRHMQAMMTETPANDPTTDRNVAHRGPSFLPWHRAFIYEFEDQLRAVDPTVTLPYWPFEQETGGTPRVFSAAYFGSDGNRLQGDRVTDGPFSSWGIVRRLGRDPDTQQTRLPSTTDVAAAMRYTTYDSAPYNEQSNGFVMAMEGWIGNNAPWGIHNGAHGYIGGDMGSMDAANDPIFWLVHANIDRLWWQWQQTNGITNYQPISGGPAGHNLNDTMRFLLRTPRPADVLDIRNDMGYTYN